MKNKTFQNWCGLLGVVSFLSYAAAVVFSPLAYPGYHWMSQAVSDLSAVSAPSLSLWNQLSSLYGVCGIVSLTMVCASVQGKLTRLLRLGIYLFAGMNWLSCVGYSLFPLSTSGYAGAFQDIMHMAVTVGVVALSIVSLVVMIVGGCREKRYRSYAVWAGIALAMMLVGAIGTGVIPLAYFGIVERCSVFAAVGFNAVLGIKLFRGIQE